MVEDKTIKVILKKLEDIGIAIAIHYIRKNKLGIPQTSKENFKILEKN